MSQYTVMFVATVEADWSAEGNALPDLAFNQIVEAARQQVSLPTHQPWGVHLEKF